MESWNVFFSLIIDYVLYKIFLNLVDLIKKKNFLNVFFWIKCEFEVSKCIYKSLRICLNR